MATLKLCIQPNKPLNAGSHQLRLAISQNGKTAYIVLPEKIDKLSQFRDGVVVGRPDAGILNRRLQSKLFEYQDIFEQINTDNYTAVQIKDILVKNQKHKALSISDVANDHIASKQKESTKSSYARTLRYFIDACGDIPVEMLSHEMVIAFDNYLMVNKEMNSTSRALHLRQLKAFVMPHIKRGSISFNIQPFADFVMPETLERELDITVEEFKLIRDYEFKEKHFKAARDLFCLSYYLGGINLIDLMRVDFRNKKTVEYVREKSRDTKRGNKIVSLTIQPEAKEIIDRWIGANGKLDFGYNYTYDNFRKYITRQIRRIAEIVGIDKRVVYYSARKSLVQHGFELGIDLNVLEYSIGHSVKSGGRPIFNYVRFMREHADKAIRTILDSLL